MIQEYYMINLWKELSYLFAHDDRMLPEIWITNLQPNEVAQIYHYLRTIAAPVSAEASFWDTILQQNRPVDDVPNAAQLVVTGEAEPFHVLLPYPTYLRRVIPDLGIFVFPDQIALDYRPGAGWTATAVESLFHVLYRLNQFAADASIQLWDAVTPAVQQHFQTVMDAYFTQLQQESQR